MPSLDDIVGGAAPTTGGQTDEEVMLDFSEAVESEKYVNGRWPAVVSECYPDVSNEGNPVLRFLFTFLDGPNKDRKIKRSSPTTGKGSGITKSALKALGFDMEQTQTRFRPSDAVNKECEIEVRDQKNNPDFQEVSRVYAKKA